MVLNDFQIDYKRLLKQEQKTLADVAAKIGKAKSSISTRATNRVINKGFEEICDALGYDIEVRYVKKN